MASSSNASSSDSFSSGDVPVKGMRNVPYKLKLTIVIQSQYSDHADICASARKEPTRSRLQGRGTAKLQRGLLSSSESRFQCLSKDSSLLLRTSGHRRCATQIAFMFMFPLIVRARTQARSQMLSCVELDEVATPAKTSRVDS